MKRILSGIFLLAAMLALAGCNTVQGLGKDIEKGGEIIQRSAQ